MSLLTRLFPSLLNSANRLTTCTSKILPPVSSFHSLTNDGTTQMNPGGLFNISTRTNIRVHFPRPNERRRIKRHGWKTRMSTPEGRRIIMNRILKGRFVYTH